MYVHTPVYIHTYKTHAYMYIHVYRCIFFALPLHIWIRLHSAYTHTHIHTHTGQGHTQGKDTRVCNTVCNMCFYVHMHTHTHTTYLHTDITQHTHTHAHAHTHTHTHTHTQEQYLLVQARGSCIYCISSWCIMYSWCIICLWCISLFIFGLYSFAA